MNEDPYTKRSERVVLAAILIWGSAVSLFSATGALSAIPRQLIAVLAVTGIAVPSLIYLRSAALKRLFAGVGLRMLTAFHIWRIGAGMLFVFYGSLGLLPEVFVNNAGYGDIIVSVLAYLVLLLPESDRGYLAFHLVGMADFVVAVSTGLTLVLSGNVLMNNLTGLPVALIPLFGVGISGTAHIIAFELLWQRRRARREGRFEQQHKEDAVGS